MPLHQSACCVHVKSVLRDHSMARPQGAVGRIGVRVRRAVVVNDLSQAAEKEQSSSSESTMSECYVLHSG